VAVRNEQNQIETAIIDDQIYRMISFPVNHFLEFIGKDKTSYYQMKKVLDFLDSLERLPPMVDYFSDGGFRSVLVFPYLRLTRKECWYVRFAIAEQLYFYRYPFHFPQTFLIYQNKYDLRVKLFFLQSFSVIGIEKELLVEDFLKKFSINHSKSLQIRKVLITILEQAQKLELIKTSFIIITKTNKTKELDKLTPNLISRAKSILYWENINRN
jgi:hypothetical protein